MYVFMYVCVNDTQKEYFYLCENEYLCEHVFAQAKGGGGGGGRARARERERRETDREREGRGRRRTIIQVTKRK